MHQRKARFLLALLFVAVSARNTAIARQPTTVPLTIIHGYPNFSADIDGHKVRLLFDSQGDSTLALTKATLDELGIKATGPSHGAMDFRGNTLEAHSFWVKRLRIGNAVFTNVRGNVELHASYVAPPLFAGYRIVLDYRARKMTLIPPGTQHIEPAGCSGTAVPSSDGIAKAQTDFGDLNLLWDTGAPVSFIRKTRIKETQAKFVDQAVLTKHFRVNGSDFGPLEFRLIEFSEPPGVDGFIGGNFFDHHVVCLDLPSKRLLIQR